MVENLVLIILVIVLFSKPIRIVSGHYYQIIVNHHTLIDSSQAQQFLAEGWTLWLLRGRLPYNAVLAPPDIAPLPMEADFRTGRILRKIYVTREYLTRQFPGVRIYTYPGGSIGPPPVWTDTSTF